MRQVQRVQGRYEAGTRCARQVQGRYKGCKAGTRPRVKCWTTNLCDLSSEGPDTITH